MDCAGEGTAQEEWHVAAALVDAPEEAWGFWGHLFVSGMGGGGGMAGLMPFINGRRMQLLEGNIGSRSMDVKELGVGEGGMFGGEEAGGGKGEEDGELEKGKERKKGKVLRAECYCKGVRFSILPPSSPAAFDAFPPAERSIVPRDKTKWYALHDPCTSCRLASGSPILSWLFTTRPHLQLPDGSPWPQYHVFGTVRVYESSEGVKRVWCGRCGAKVAYVHESRPEVVDVAVGLLVDEGDGEGVLHKGSLEWRTGLSEFKGDAVWKGVVGALEEGILAAGMEGRV